MGNTSVKEAPPTAEAASASKNEAEGEKKKLKPCCACPETKKARDQW